MKLPSTSTRNFALRVNEWKKKLRNVPLDISEYFFPSFFLSFERERQVAKGVYLGSGKRNEICDRARTLWEVGKRDTRRTTKGNDEEAKADKSAALVRISYRSILQRR